LPLPYEQARELISILHHISRKPVIMVFDAWEQSASLDAEHKTLASFLSHIEDWPQCHVLLGVRHPELAKADSTGRGFEAVKDLEHSAPGTAKTYDLPLMHLNNATEQHNLTAFIRTKVAAASGLDDRLLLGMLQSFPGVLNFWLSDALCQEMKDAKDMARVAQDAQAYRYREFDILFPQLPPAERRLAIRLAIFPRLDSGKWQLFRAILLDGISESSVDELNIRHVLVGGDFPAYGHETRYTAIRHWLLNKPEYRSMVAGETNDLLFRLGESVPFLTKDAALFNAAILLVGALALTFSPEVSVMLVVASAASMLGDIILKPQLFLKGVRSTVSQHPIVRTLIATGLVNMQCAARAQNQPKVAATLLNELRWLAAKHPTDAMVRERLASALFNAVNDVLEEHDLKRSEELLNELRTLAHTHPAEAVVRERLATGLFNTLNYAGEKGDPTRLHDMLNQLRTLARSQPTDMTVRKVLAMGIVNTASYINGEDRLTRRGELLNELRSLVQTYPTDETAQEWLANGLFNALTSAIKEGDVECRDILLSELQVLARLHPMNATLRTILAGGLFNIVCREVAESDWTRLEKVLKDLRELARDHPTDTSVSKLLAKALFNIFQNVKGENKMKRLDDLLGELRALANAHPNNAVVRMVFARALFNRLNYARQENALDLRNDLLNELRALVHAHPTDDEVQEWFAKGLFNTHLCSKEEGDLERRDEMLAELRRLAQIHSINTAVRVSFANALFNTIHHARDENDLKRRDASLNELRSLAQTFPDEIEMIKCCAGGVQLRLKDSEIDGDALLTKSLTVELHQLEMKLSALMGSKDRGEASPNQV
jgi:hypothetical protein